MPSYQQGKICSPLTANSPWTNKWKGKQKYKMWWGDWQDQNNEIKRYNQNHFPQLLELTAILKLESTIWTRASFPLTIVMQSYASEPSIRYWTPPLSVKRPASGIDVLATWYTHACTSSCKQCHAAEEFHWKHTSLPLRKIKR